MKFNTKPALLNFSLVLIAAGYLSIAFFAPNQLLAQGRDKAADKALVNQVAATFSQNFIANFSAEIHDNYHLEPVTSSGKLYFKKGGLMRFEYSMPDEQLIILGKKNIWIYDPALNTVTIASVKTISNLNSLFFLNSPNKLADNFYIISKPQQNLLHAMTGQKLLFLKSNDPSNPVGEIHLAYNADTKLIEQLGIIDTQNLTRIFKFSEFAFPSQLLDEKFEFIVPKNVDVIQEE